MTRRRPSPTPAALALAACASLAVAAPASADDALVERVFDEMSGSVRAGWRFLRNEGDGRFLEDARTSEGGQIFEAELRGDSTDTDTPAWFELGAHGVGDDEQSYRFAFGKRGLWDLSLGHDRDDYSYRATGDGDPYDTRRERSNLRFRLTPTNRVTVRVDWDRNLRRGDAWVGADTDLREPTRPQGVDPDIVQEHRPLRQQGDRVTVGVDASFGGGFRASLAESVRVQQIDDTRLYDVPADRRGATPVREAFRRKVRSPAWTTVAKAGWTSDDRAIDVNGIFSYTRQDLDTRLHADTRGFDTRFDPMGVAQRGEFRGTTTGSNDSDRSLMQGRLEGTWRVAKDWELTGALEEESVTDDASLRLVERREYVRTDFTAGPDRRAYDARIVHRLCRSSLEAAWEVLDGLRLRGGAEYLRENLRVPTDSRTDDPFATNFSSTSWRGIAGADWEPRKDIDLSLLVKHSTNDDPHAATSAETGDELIWRGRWKASEALSMTTVWRHRGFRQQSDFDSASRSDSVSVGGAWTSGPVTVSPNVSWLFTDTRTDTKFYDYSTGSFRQQLGQVQFLTRDVTANLDVRWTIAKSARAFFTASWIGANGDYEATWGEASLGGEYDVRKNLTVGAALRTWRLNEADTSVDDYRALGFEVWMTFRF